MADEPAPGLKPASAPWHDGLDARPFPLRRLFLRRVLPGLVILAIALSGATVLATRIVTERIYLQLAEDRAAGLAAGMSKEAPKAWKALINGDILGSGDFDHLAAAFERERKEFKLNGLKVYAMDGRTLYSDEPTEIGTVETSSALTRIIATGHPGTNEHVETDGHRVMELYVPYRQDGKPRAIFELYEPVAELRGILAEVGLPVVAIPLALLGLLMASLAVIVKRAQADIDRRTGRIVSLTRRIESLVSRRAVSAAEHDEGGGLATEKLDMTLLFSDVRGFTSYSEGHPPQEVLTMLDALVGLQIASAAAHGGDVDKMIGDAVFVRFEGEGRQRAAIEAALDIQARMHARHQNFALGIGIASGPVVAGGLGAEGRFDYTVIGDAVNVASRLSAMAAPGEIMVDAGTVEAAGMADWENPNAPRCVAARRQYRCSGSLPGPRDC